MRVLAQIVSTKMLKRWFTAIKFEIEFREAMREIRDKDGYSGEAGD